MSETRDLLIEIGTEELPPKALRRLSLAFADGISAGLEATALKPSRIVPYAAPRRLAVPVADLPVAQQDREGTAEELPLQELPVRAVADATRLNLDQRLVRADLRFRQLADLGLVPARNKDALHRHSLPCNAAI